MEFPIQVQLPLLWLDGHYYPTRTHLVSLLFEPGSVRPSEGLFGTDLRLEMGFHPISDDDPMTLLTL
jgi:hypothetical protein